MWLYIIIFLIPVLLYQHTIKSGISKNTYLLGIYLFFLALFVGLSDMFGGYDRYIYAEVFDSIADVTDSRGSYLLNQCFDFFPSEKGYTLLNIIISFFTENRYIFIFVLTAAIYTCLFVSIKRYAVNYPFALILFLGLWFFFTFTYLRQVLGATIVWLSIPYIIKRKFWKSLAICLVAMSIHKSAIIFLPVYFIANKEFSVKQIKRAMLILLIIGMSPLPNALFTAYGDVSQFEMQADYSSAGGLRIAYLLEVGFFFWIILKNYHTPISNPTQRVLINIALLFCATLLFFIRSENGGRLSWYYMIGIICTLTTIATKKINRKNLAPLLIVVCFFLMLRIYDSWQPTMNLYPYKTFLTDGHRQGDPVWENYEYDTHYDGDKFYRKPFRIKFNIEKND